MRLGKSLNVLKSADPDVTRLCSMTGNLSDMKELWESWLLMYSWLNLEESFRCLYFGW